MCVLPEQDEVEKIPEARQQLAHTEIILTSTRRNLKRAKRELHVRRFRLIVASSGAPQWLASLILSSVTTVLISIVLISVVRVGAGLFFTLILVVYGAAGASAVWLLRNRDGENSETLLVVRAKKFADAQWQRKVTEDAFRAAVVEAQRSRRVLAELEHEARVEAVRQATVRAAESRQAELLASMRQQVAIDRMNQLLGVDADCLTGEEFEQYVAAIFEFLGYTTSLTKKSGDQGVDIVAEKEGVKLAIQAKCWRGSVGNGAVQEVVAGRAHYGCHQCIVVTNSYFTTGANALAQSNNCVLIGKIQLPTLIRGEWTF